MRLSQQQVDLSVVGILLEQTFENSLSSVRLTHANERGAPREEQPGILGRMIQKRLEHGNHFCIILLHGITEAEKLPAKRVIRVGFQLTLQRCDSLRVSLGAEAGQTPIAVKARKKRIPGCSLLEVFSCSGEV